MILVIQKLIVSAITNVEETIPSHVEMDIIPLFLFMKLECEQNNLIRNSSVILSVDPR